VAQALGAHFVASVF